MSSVTVTDDKAPAGASASGSATGSASTTTTQRRGNVHTFKPNKEVTKGLVAIDTEGNEYKVPDFGMKEILGAIPKECYERSYMRGFAYIARDILLAGLMMYAATTLIPMVPNQFVRGLLWVAHGICVSLPYTGLWVMAHECGHQAFSKYGWLNDTVGWVVHSYLLVPYFSWKYSHGKHHKATGHLDRDMVFVPPRKDEFKERRNVVSLKDLAADTPVATLQSLLIQQFGGWWWYLLTNVTGQKYPGYNKFAVSHFNPNSPIFEKRDYWFVVLSDIGILAQFGVIYGIYKHFGGFNLLVNWFIPYVFTNHWLVFITYLQHTDVSLPHYEDNEWNFARGAAATIDREFNFIGPFFFHDIIETHVLHHYCSRIPFYNARVGTEAIKKVMGDYYVKTTESMWVSLWKSGRSCEFVDGDNGVLMFRNHNGLGVEPKDD